MTKANTKNPKSDNSTTQNKTIQNQKKYVKKKLKNSNFDKTQNLKLIQTYIFFYQTQFLTKI